jgi:hypothetical protein
MRSARTSRWVKYVSPEAEVRVWVRRTNMAQGYFGK